jgi:hypothetical protein
MLQVQSPHEAKIDNSQYTVTYFAYNSEYFYLTFDNRQGNWQYILRHWPLLLIYFYLNLSIL